MIPLDEGGNSNPPSSEESGHECSNNLEVNIPLSSWKANPSSEVIHRAARFIYSSDFGSTEKQKKSILERSATAYSNSEFRNSFINDCTEDRNDNIHSKKSQSQLKCDISDYYEKYSPTTAKTLIDTLLLSRKEICKQCARFEDSPVYSDRLIYTKKILYAREIVMFQYGDSVNFKSRQSRDSFQSSQLCDYMPVCNLAKSNASGIFYFSGPQDVFDLRSSLEPEIVIINSEFSGITNTQVYHRPGSDTCSRISQIRSTSIRFFPNRTRLTNLENFSFDKDLNNWMNSRNHAKLRNSKESKYLIPESQPNRASLLLLEPLLLMPSFPQSEKECSKSRISHADNLSLVKIIISYTLAFFIVTIITFYVVYFT